MIPTARYGAFISYSHAGSGEVARGLQKWLQPLIILARASAAVRMLLLPR
jgi:hypothetical protein